MNNSISSFHEDGWIYELSEIRNELDQTEIDEIEFLHKDSFQGELIPESFKILWLITLKIAFTENVQRFQNAVLGLIASLFGVLNFM